MNQTDNVIDFRKATPRLDAKLQPLEFLGEIISKGPYETLSEAFVIESIRHYSNVILQNERPTEHGNGVVSQIEWYNIAEFMRRRITSNFGE